MSELVWKFLPLYKKQKEIYDCKERRITVMAGRQAGKTTLMFQIACRELLKAKYKSGKKVDVLYVTPKNNLADQFFKEFLAILPEDLVKETNITKRTILFYNDAKITFKGAEAGVTSFRGFRHSLVICDEFAHYKNLENLWLEGIEPSMLSYKQDARVYWVSTPLGENFFYKQYMRGFNYELGYASFYFTSLDSPFLDRADIEKKREELGELVFNQEYLALPAANAANPFGLHINKNIIPSPTKGKPEAIGIDLAKHFDFSVILSLSSNKEGYAEMCYPFERWNKVDWGISKAKIKALPRHVDKLMDVNSIGDVIYDDLRYEVPNLKPFQFNNTSKTNLIQEFVKAVEEGKVKYTQDVANEMNTFVYQYNAKSGKLTYGAQDGYHDDLIIACALSWWAYNRRTRRSNNWCIGRA